MANIDVMLHLEADTPAGTNLWATEGIIRLLSEVGEITDVRQIGLYVQKLQLLCNANFRIYMPKIVKLEFGKTYCIHLEQYRIVGFFDQSYRDFIAVDYFVKKRQRNDNRMNAVYQKVDGIREAKAWTRQK
jgi:hypothetical protein